MRGRALGLAGNEADCVRVRRLAGPRDTLSAEKVPAHIGRWAQALTREPVAH